MCVRLYILPESCQKAVQRMSHPQGAGAAHTTEHGAAQAFALRTPTSSLQAGQDRLGSADHAPPGPGAAHGRASSCTGWPSAHPTALHCVAVAGRGPAAPRTPKRWPAHAPGSGAAHHAACGRSRQPCDCPTVRRRLTGAPRAAAPRTTGTRPAPAAAPCAGAPTAAPGRRCRCAPPVSAPALEFGIRVRERHRQRRTGVQCPGARGSTTVVSGAALGC